jgi:NAD(P)H-nitrite reductase large subunit
MQVPTSSSVSSMSGESRHVVIIGNGIAGSTAARTIRKLSDHRITMISAESDHPYSRPALMYVFMGHLTFEHTKLYEDFFWKKNRIDLHRATVERIDPSSRTVHLVGGVRLAYDELILATGATHNMFGWPGQDLKGVQGFTNLSDLTSLEARVKHTRRAVIVGGGLIGVEVAEMLRSRGIDVTFLVREDRYWKSVLAQEESETVEQHIRDHGVDLRTNTELLEILGQAGTAIGVRTTSGTVIDCETVVITAGVHPRTDLAQRSGINVGRGILVDDRFRTSAPNIFAIGDCAERPNGHVDLLWYSGRAHGQHVASVVCGSDQPYHKEDFYNSAKFFDIEYSTYGHVAHHFEPWERRATLPDGSTISTSPSCWLWQGADGRRLLRIAHYHDTVIGFNALGIRLRASQCHLWINQRASLADVLAGLKLADFDPEFFTTMRDIQRVAV